MRALITGVTGFVGSHLAEFLLAKSGMKVIGVGRSPRALALKGRLKEVPGKFSYCQADLMDFSAAKRALKIYRPDRIFHLAGVSSVRESWKDPARALQVNIQGQLNLFEAVRELGIRPRIQIAGSSEVYGEVPDSCRMLDERAPFKPLSPYGMSKAIQDLLVRQYFRSSQFPVVVTRAFPHTGPRQDAGFVASNFAKQIARIEAGKQKPVLRVGNLKLIRDFTDVRDIVRAYWLALEKGESGEAYNICSGEGLELRRIVEFYVRACFVKVKVAQDSSRLRLKEPLRVVGDPKKFMARTSWRPVIDLETTLADLLNYWRKEVAP